MKRQQKYNDLLKNTALFGTANIANKLILFLLLPFYTSYLTAEEYGVIDLILITQQLIFPLVTLDMTEAVVRFGMEKDADRPAVFSIGFVSVVTGNIILVAGSCAAAGLGIWDSRYVLCFCVYSVSSAFYTLFSAFLRTEDKIKLVTAASIANTCIAAVLNIWLVAGLRSGISGYFTAVVAGNLAAIALMMPGMRIRKRLKKVGREIWNRYGRAMLWYAVPMIPNAVFWWINSSLDRYFLTLMGTLSSVGLYAAANRIPSILASVTSVFQQAWSLSLFKESESGSRQAFFTEVFRIYDALNVLTAAIMISVVQMVCRILLNREFYSAWPWVPWLILGFYSNSISSFAGTEFTAAKRTGWIVITTCIGAAANIVLNLALIPGYGGAGAAAATCISCFVLCEIRIWLLRRFFSIEFNNRDILQKHGILTILAVSISMDAGWLSRFAALCCLAGIIIGEWRIIKPLFLRRKRG